MRRSTERTTLTRRTTRARTLLGTLAATVLLAAGCTAQTGQGAAPSASVPAAPAASTASAPTAADAACVSDPAGVIARPAAQTSGDLPADQTAKLDAAVTSALTSAVPGAVVGVRTPDGTWTHAYGKADAKTGAKMTVGTHTRIGSVTKTFTTSVVLKLAEDGKLSLDDPIAKYVPGVPNGEKISLRQLANMTSGVASYTLSKAFTDRYFAHPETVFTPEQVLKVGLSKSPLFAPGAKFDYSNTNTVLLGMVIEKVTGAPVQDAIKADVLDPLNLTHTSWPGTSVELPEPYADGYTLQGDHATPARPANATHWNQAWGWTAGELISDVADLLTFGQAMGTGQGLFDAASQTTRLTSFPTPAGGYGFGFGCIGGWVGHTGEIPGYNTTVYYDTTTGTTVVVQVNSDIASGSCKESPTLTDDPGELPCSSPATRIFVALSTALGHPFDAIPRQ